MGLSKAKKIGLIIVGVLVLVFLETRFSILSKVVKFIFVKSKLEVVETPSIILKVVGINELVSAEYCSETYCSLSDKTVFAVEYYVEQEKKDNLYLFNRVKAKLQEYSRAGIADSKLSEHFSSDTSLDHLRTHKQFGVLLDLCASRGLNDKLLEIKNKSRSTYRGVKFNRYYDKRTRELERIQNKADADVVYIGRGCVQVGVDFQNFGEESIEILPDSSFVLKGIKVEMLSNYINPWFVPNEVPGFEFWGSEKDRKLNYADVTSTKSKCIENLRAEALGLDIKLKALNSTITSLTKLLNTMDRKYNTCIVETPIHEYLYESILADSIITRDELGKLRNFDSSFTQELDSGLQLKIKDNGKYNILDVYDKLIQFCQRRNQTDPIEILDQLVLGKRRLENG